MTSLARHLALGIPISDFQGVPTQHWCGFWGPNPDPHAYIATTLTTEQSPQLPRWSFWKWLLSYCLLLPPDPLWEVVSDDLELFSLLPWCIVSTPKYSLGTQHWNFLACWFLPCRLLLWSQSLHLNIPCPGWASISICRMPMHGSLI